MASVGLSGYIRSSLTFYLFVFQYICQQPRAAM